jgi:hypothetical protein
VTDRIASVTKQATLSDGSHMSLTLRGTPGLGVTLDVLAGVCREWDGLLRAIGKEVAPAKPLEWRVVTLAVLDDAIRIGVVGQPKRRKSRTRPKKPA